MAKKTLTTDKKAAWRYFSDFIRPAKAFGYDDEKRMQERFSDRSLHLCWNIKNRQCEIWYLEEHQMPYCILTMKDRYNFPKAMHERKQRERSNKDILDSYTAQQEQADKDQARQIKEYTRPYAQQLWNEKVGKVSIQV